MENTQDSEKNNTDYLVMADQIIQEAKQSLQSFEKEVEKKIGTKDEGKVHALILQHIEKIEAAKKEVEIKLVDEEEDE